MYIGLLNFNKLLNNYSSLITPHIILPPILFPSSFFLRGGGLFETRFLCVEVLVVLELPLYTRLVLNTQ